MIAGGRKVRCAPPYFFASLVACRHNPILKAFRQRLLDAGKPKMLVAHSRGPQTPHHPQRHPAETNNHGAHKPLDYEHSR